MYKTREVKVGPYILGTGHPVRVQSMCNTDTRNAQATADQINLLENAGCEINRIAVPDMQAAQAIGEIKKRIHSPLVADIHFDYKLALEAIKQGVDKVRINPGNIGAVENTKEVVKAAKDAGVAIRIGVNAGSVKYLKSVQGKMDLSDEKWAEVMVNEALEQANILEQLNFKDVVVSLKSDNFKRTVLANELFAKQSDIPLHIGLTEAGSFLSGTVKSAVALGTLLQKGIGATIRVSLTEDPVNEIPVAMYLADRYDGKLHSSMVSLNLEGNKAVATYHAPSRDRLMLDMSCDFGKMLLDRKIDEVEIKGYYKDANGETIGLDSSETAAYFTDELLQAARRKFYRPEYIACPGCGRTMYNLESAFDEVKRRTSHLNGMVIAVMGCIVNGPGEMADADWGYVGEGNRKVSIYKGKTPVMRHVPEAEAVDCLLKLIEEDEASR